MQIETGAFLERSRVNGPGLRSVLWVQGCPFRCGGCFNPEFQVPGKGTWVTIEEMAKRIVAIPDTEGVTFSGGEPFAQAEPLGRLAEQIQAAGKSVMIFSGYEKANLLETQDPSFRQLLKNTDLIVAGSYQKDTPCHHPLLSSVNQELIFLTDRYAEKDILPGTRRMEIQINTGGTTVMTGFPKEVN